MKAKATQKVIEGQYAQGDVLLTRIDAPDLANLGQPIARNKITLALGETTGHVHLLEGDAVAEFATVDGQRLFWVEAPANLAHATPSGEPTQEHDWLVIEPGWYVWKQPQAEYTPEQSRPVFD